MSNWKPTHRIGEGGPECYEDDDQPYDTMRWVWLDSRVRVQVDSRDLIPITPEQSDYGTAPRSGGSASDPADYEGLAREAAVQIAQKHASWHYDSPRSKWVQEVIATAIREAVEKVEKRFRREIDIMLDDYQVAHASERLAIRERDEARKQLEQANATIAELRERLAALEADNTGKERE